jgi:hypothetical protein
MELAVFRLPSVSTHSTVRRRFWYLHSAVYDGGKEEREEGALYADDA